MHIEARLGNVGNGLVDAKAKSATSLLLPPPAFLKELWQFACEGEPVDGPHEVWAKGLVPSHSATPQEFAALEAWVCVLV